MQSLAFNAVEIAAGGSLESRPIVLEDGKTDHAMEYEITGDGTISISVYTSISGRKWVLNGVKGSSLTKTSGPESNGVDNIPLLLKPGDLIKFKFTETGGAEAVTLSLWFTQK